MSDNTSDLLERLRDPNRGDPVGFDRAKAADEIERLNAKADTWITTAGQHAAACDEKDREINLLRAQRDAYAEEIGWLRVALSSIARNTCCDRCQEAALVAQAALKGEKA